MVFASPIFLFAYLPAMLLLYWLARPRNAVLLLASLLFYAWGEPVYLALMAFGILANWLIALGIKKRKRKILLILAIALDLGMLAVFKYADMAISGLNRLLRADLPMSGLALPLGISFYTFQMLSYVVDVWRGDAEAERNIIAFGAYVSMFPQLIAGPIVRYRDIAKDLHADRKLDLSRIGEGARRFCLGLGKKVLLADTLSRCADTAFGLGGGALGAGAAWMGAVCYALEIYFDFSGYSDMAIGLGRMLGFRFPENFDHPYISASVREFWRRWHMTLSGWFRDYLYIPLGGSRRGTVRTGLNLMIVFVLCGLWHGAGLSFVLWGLYHGLFLALERAPLLKRKRPRAVGIPVTMLTVLVGWVIFRADTPGEAWSYLMAMAGQGGGAPVSAVAGLTVYPALAAGLMGCAPWLDRVRRWIGRHSRAVWAFDLAGALAAACVLALCAVMLAGGTYTPFIYFRF